MLRMQLNKIEISNASVKKGREMHNSYQGDRDSLSVRVYHLESLYLDEYAIHAFLHSIVVKILQCQGRGDQCCFYKDMFRPWKYENVIKLSKTWKVWLRTRWIYLWLSLNSRFETEQFGRLPNINPVINVFLNQGIHVIAKRGRLFWKSWEAEENRPYPARLCVYKVI